MPIMRKLLVFLICLLSLPTLGFGEIRQISQTQLIPAPKIIAIAADREENLYLADNTGTVRVVTVFDEAVRTLPSQGKDGRPLLQEPSSMAIHDDKIYVSDADLDRVVIFTTSGDYLGSFGQSGDDPKEFDAPRALAVCCGRLYVADSENGRVQVFSLDGIYLDTLGRSGSGDALLSEPTHLVADPFGRLVILDDDKIKIFSATGEFLRTLPLPYRPLVLAADPEGIYFADKYTLKVVKIDYDGKEIFSFGSKGKDDSQFLSINSMALSPGGRILVGDDKKGALHVLTTGSSPLLPSFSTPPRLTTVQLVETTNDISLDDLTRTGDEAVFGILAGNEKKIVAIKGKKIHDIFSLPGWNPVALAGDLRNNLWVLDEENSKVMHLSTEGVVLKSFGCSGGKDGCFAAPSDLYVSSKGLVYVVDSGNERIQVFSPEGMLLRILGGNVNAGLFNNPVSMAFLEDSGTLFVLDGDSGIVTVLDAQGKTTLTFGGRGTSLGHFVDPMHLAVTADEVIVLDTDPGMLKFFNHQGKYLYSIATKGKEAGDLLAPTAFLALNDADFLVADQGNNRLQLLHVFHTPEMPGKVTGSAGQRSANLRWQKNAENYVSAYKVYRSENPDDDYREIAQVSGNSLSDVKLEANVNYYYRVTACAKNGHESSASAPVKVTPTKIVPPPPAQVKANTQEWSVDLSWSTESPEFISSYRVYRKNDNGYVLIGSPKTTEYYDGNLDPQTPYEYEVSAISIDGVESLRTSVKLMTLATTRPPLEITIGHLEDIFSNSYKLYEEKGVGRITITNNTRDQLSKIKVAFTLKEFMDFPAELEISNLAPHSSEELVLKAVFNNLILNFTEDTSVQAEIVATYYKNQEQVKISTIQPLRVFEKHRMLWDERERFAAFVTPKDPIILEFGRSIASQYSEYADSILYAGVIFDALGVAGISYMQDPSNPYQVISGQTAFVDYIQYPRETLSRRAGDCDDLVALYGSLLESMGIRTMVVEVPEHMFLLFATSFKEQSVGETLRNMAIEHDGALWIPVEVTQVGSPFMKAWDSGLNSYRQWQGKGLRLMDIQSAWGTYKPASLPMLDWRPTLVTKDKINTRFKDELLTLRRIRMQNLGQKVLSQLKVTPKDPQLLLQLGIIYARAGEPEEAIILLEKANKILPDHSSTLNNLGNSYFLLERYEQAEASYSRASELGVDDPEILINLARTQLRLDKRKDAIMSFQKAVALRPELAEKYRTMAITLGSSY